MMRLMRVDLTALLCGMSQPKPPHIVPNLVAKYQLRNESLRRAILNLQSDATAHVFAHSVFDLDAGITMHVLLDAGVDLCRAYAEYAGITAALLSIYTL